MNNLTQKNLIKTPSFKGDTINIYNNLIIEKSKNQNISNYVIFDIEKLKIKVGEHKNFTKGLITYLVEVNKQLDKVSEDRQFKSWVFQIIAELGTLVYPNIGTSYSLIPQDLKKIDWYSLKKNYAKRNLKGNSSKEEAKQINLMFSDFFDEENQYPQTLICIISASLSGEFAHSINQSFININENPMVSEMPIQFKASSWLNRLASNLKHHIIAINFYKINKHIDDIDILPYCKALAVEITGILQNNKLFYSSFYNKEHNPNQKVSVFLWKGSNFLIYPKILALPMRCEPQDWVIDSPSTAKSGGFILSEFTNISYQGYLDNKSFQMHNHKLRINQSIKQINQLQKVKYMINDKMVNFINKYKFELTDTDILLITDKWTIPNDDTLLSLNKKWGQVYKKTDDARKAITGERITKRNETLRNQDMLNIAQLFVNNPFHWPAVHDFRGRIYRISSLNIQMNAFARSLICFYSTKPPVTNRKKNKKTFEQFNLLLKEILNDDNLIQEWDAVFGNRFLNNNTFDNLLLTALKDQKLSLIQVSQLLLLRAKEYDKIGIYYDASASAYQIIGMLNLDSHLCELTNVIGHAESKKNDIYEFFKTELANSDYKNLTFQLDKDARMSTLIENCLTTQMDRQLVKAAVMPLIYGKTAYGFSDDLNDFFAKHYLYPSNSPLLKLANLIINQLKTHPTLNRANDFMAFIRDFAKVLFDINNVVLVGPYNECTISYHQVAIERLNVYSHKKDTGVQRQRISLNTLKKNETGVPIRSKTKTVNAFVANFIHFIDGQICHFVIEQFFMLGYTNIGTIHDCFYIKPEHKIELQCIYKAGLVMGIFIYELNLAKWIESLIKHHQIPVCNLKDYIRNLENAILSLRKEKRNYQMAVSEFKRSPIINNEVLTAAIELIQQKADYKSKASLKNLLAFLKERDINNYTIILNKLTMKGGNALYSDNE